MLISLKQFFIAVTATGKHQGLSWQREKPIYEAGRNPWELK
jgi:hypothetical protein